MRGFFESAGRVERHHNGAESEHGLIDDDPFGAIFGKNRDSIARLDAEAPKPGAEFSRGSEISFHE